VAEVDSCGERVGETYPVGGYTLDTVGGVGRFKPKA
jgi:hypothetical protein